MNNFWYRNYEEINYLSLADLNGGVGQTPFTAKKEAKGILGFIFEVLGEPAMVHDDEHTNKLFQDYIWPRFYQEAIVRGEGKDDIGRVLGGIYSWVMATKDNYGYLIDTYESKKDLLLGQVKTTQTTDTNNSGTSKTTSNDTMNGEVNGTTSGNGSDKVVITGEDHKVGESTTTNNLTDHSGTVNSGEEHKVGNVTTNNKTKVNITPQISNLEESDEFVNNITNNNITTDSEENNTNSSTITTDETHTGTVKVADKQDNTNSSTNTTTSTNSNTAKTTTKDTKQGTVNGETTDTGKSTTSIASDGDTLMARIKEVREGIENVYETWCEEFKQFIIW